jgi:DNA-binding HxlR family transcriptional regulator
LAATTGYGSGNGARSGAQTLALLAGPLNIAILRALAHRPRRQTDLRREVGLPAQTTLRTQLKRLSEIGAISKERRDGFPGMIDYQITIGGHELLLVVETLARWLAISPSGPLRVDDNAAKAAINALAEGWSTTVLRALAASPLSLTELNRVIASLSYPSLERRLGALRLAGQIEAMPSNGRGTPYGVTDWLRHGVAPLAAAARWERRRAAGTSPPIRRLDIEGMFLLALPLLRLPTETAGTCRMAMEIQNGGRSRSAGVTTTVERGGITACTINLESRADAWVHGSTTGWLEAITERDTDRLELGGDCGLARALLDGLQGVLFPTAVAPPAPLP